MTDSQKKTALITGSATGVGAATALQLAQRGWNVVVNYSRSEQEAQETAAACRAAGADVLVLQADVSQDADCRHMVDQTVARWGRLDALDAEVFQRIMGVNAVGTFQMVRAAVPHLKAAQGSIVNVSSVAGVLGIGSSLPYIASKGAINSMTLHLARSLAPDIRVNAVCPGFITSRWFARGLGEAAADKARQTYESTVPLGRASTPEDVAESIVWLVTGARTVTGELVLLDSGTHLGGDLRRR